MTFLSLPRWPVRISASIVALALSLFAFAGSCPGSETRPAVTIPPFDSPFAIIISDLNGDGFPDIAAAVTYVAGPPPHPGFVSVFLQNPEAPGKFFAGVHYPTGTDPVALAAADLNGDGYLDLVVADSTEGKISILMQDPLNPGQFLPKTQIAVGGSPNGIAIADIDGDGRADIVAAVTSHLKILFQDSSGSPGTFLPPVTVATGHGSGAVAIGDINGDGVPDLVSVSGVVSVLLQDPDHRGTFLPPADYAAGPQPSAIKIGDLNGDGLPDLAVANLGTPSNLNTANVSVLLQDPAHPGGFRRRTNYPTAAGTLDAAIGDLNGDGQPDLATTNTFAGLTGSVSVLLQKPPHAGKLAFGRTNYPGKSGPASIAIGDLNGDGKPDLALADGDAATIMFQKPNLPGKFFKPVAAGK